MQGQTDYYRIRFDADPMQLLFFRHGLDRWLNGLDWPEPDRIDAVLAVHEACANVVEHAYENRDQGDVEVTGRLVVCATARHLVIVVRDHGRWRPADAGLGLTAARACTARLKIHHDADGTSVTLTTRPVPLLDVGVDLLSEERAGNDR